MRDPLDTWLDVRHADWGSALTYADPREEAERFASEISTAVKYYSFLEAGGQTEGLFRVTWLAHPNYRRPIPGRSELMVDDEWVEWPALTRHFVPGGLGLQGYEESSDRVIEVEPPISAAITITEGGRGGNPYHCPPGTGITAGRFTDKDGSHCHPQTQQLSTDGISLRVNQLLAKRTRDGNSKLIERELRIAMEVLSERSENRPGKNPEKLGASAKIEMESLGFVMGDSAEVETAGRMEDLGDEFWNDVQPSTVNLEELSQQGRLVVTEDHVWSKPISKVVWGDEKLRGGYFILLYENKDNNYVVVDGHHRVAMHTLLGTKNVPVRIAPVIPVTAAFDTAPYAKEVPPGDLGVPGFAESLKPGYNPYRCPTGTGLSAGQFTDAAGSTCHPQTSLLETDYIYDRYNDIARAMSKTDDPDRLRDLAAERALAIDELRKRGAMKPGDRVRAKGEYFSLDEEGKPIPQDREGTIAQIFISKDNRPSHATVYFDDRTRGVMLLDRMELAPYKTPASERHAETSHSSLEDAFAWSEPNETASAALGIMGLTEFMPDEEIAATYESAIRGAYESSEMLQELASEYGYPDFRLMRSDWNQFSEARALERKTGRVGGVTVFLSPGADMNPYPDYAPFVSVHRNAFVGFQEEEGWDNPTEPWPLERASDAGTVRNLRDPERRDPTLVDASITGIVVHELAHYYERRIAETKSRPVPESRLQDDPDIQRWMGRDRRAIRNDVSPYAAESTTELVAELFTAMTHEDFDQEEWRKNGPVGISKIFDKVREYYS